MTKFDLPEYLVDIDAAGHQAAVELAFDCANKVSGETAILCVLTHKVPGSGEGFGALWVATQSYMLEFMEFPAVKHFDIVQARSTERVFFNFSPHGQSIDKANWLQVEFRTAGGVAGRLHAEGTNSRYLLQFVRKVLVMQVNNR